MQTVIKNRRGRALFFTLLLLAAMSSGWAGWHLTQVAAQNVVTTVNAASFNADRTVSPDTIVAAFGTFITQNNQAFTADTQPLPTNLGGVRVRVNNIDAGIFFAAPTQINFLVPNNVPDGTSVNVVVTNSNNSTRNGTVVVRRSAPGIFAASANGQGAAAAVTTFDGLTYLAVADGQGNELPVDAGTRERPNILVLYGTGIRNAPAAVPNDENGVAEAVSVRFRGVPGRVLYAGPAPGFSGLDQINVAIPPELSGLGSVPIIARIADRDSNTVTISLGGETAVVRTQAVSFGQTVNGALTIDDQVQLGGGGNSFFFDAYEFNTTQPNTSIAIDLRSPEFDTTVLLYRVNGNLLSQVAADDQSGRYGAPFGTPNDDALLLTILQTPGRYVAFATSADKSPNAVGSYTITFLNNVAQPISYDQIVQGSITTSDLKTSANGYLDVYWFNGGTNDNVRIALNSSAFNAFLILHGNDGDPPLTFNDNESNSSTNSLLNYRLPASGIYLIIATPYAPNITGNYTLTLNRVAGFAAEEAAAAAPAQLLAPPGRELYDQRGLAPMSSIERYGRRRVVPQ